MLTQPLWGLVITLLAMSPFLFSHRFFDTTRMGFSHVVTSLMGFSFGCNEVLHNSTQSSWGLDCLLHASIDFVLTQPS